MNETALLLIIAVSFIAALIVAMVSMHEAEADRKRLHKRLDALEEIVNRKAIEDEREAWGRG